MDLQSKPTYEFGPFVLDAEERLLLKNGEPVPLTSKVFDTLLALVQNSGHALEKDELMKAVWPDSFVEEVNLAHNISVLRRALGEYEGGISFIETLPRRGYRFVAAVNHVSGEPSALLVHEHKTLVIEHEEEASPKSDTVSHTKSRIGRRLVVVTLLVLAAFLGAVAWYQLKLGTPREPTAQSEIHSIAVLPFKPLVAESRDEVIEMGVAESLITSLSSIRQIVVRPLSAVRKYTELDQDALAAGREQKVDAVLDGSIQRDGENIRVTVRLLSTHDGRQLWAGSFDERNTDIFALEDAINDRVVKTLTVNLTAGERGRLAKHQTEHSEAYSLYLKGRYFTNKWTQDGWKRGIDYFRQAIALDPDYSLAYAGLAETYAKAVGDYLPNQQARPQAEEAITTALALDGELAEAHVTRAWMKAEFDWDWTAAEWEFRRGIELNSSSARELFGLFLKEVGRFDEALAELERAQEFEPLSLEILNVRALTLRDMGQYDLAIEQYRKVLEMDSNSSLARRGLGTALLLKGMPDAAIEELLKAQSLNGIDAKGVAELRAAYVAAGFKGYWRRLLAWATGKSPRTYVSPYHVAQLYAQLDDTTLAFEWLERAYAERNVYMIELKYDPLLGGLRSDVRFADLMRRVGLPQ